ncbi:unnamed protein product [Adineta steineri]|uniref:USP domain-containing protein n=1 Tax=Adineta steineri TaxID=433720 RepID=A0A819NTG5_9BILA|nr:unnamed protein product [Adineta steineri]
MLQDLFDEDREDGDFSYQFPSSTSSKSIIEKPISPRNETDLCGLQNQGATCYLNALIQTLLFTPDFREPLFSLTAKDLNLLSNPNDSSQTSSSGSTLKVRKIIVELQKLFAEMLLLNQQACSSIRLTDSFGWQSNETIDHQDVHELNRLLFDAIQKSLQGTKQSNLIRSCYEGSTINYTQCKQCQKIFKRIEDYQDLPLVVQDSPNLHTSLANMFTYREQLTGDNQYRCSSCDNRLCDADKWAKISKLPPILTLPLQRFIYDIKTGNRLKKTTRYEFPFDIDLKEFCEDSVIDTNYELFAVVIHKGTCYSGHYYGYIKDVDHIGTWIRPPPPPSSAAKSSNKQKPSNTNSNNNRNSTKNDSTETDEEISKKIELIKTILLSCDDWFTIDDLLKTYRENTTVPWSRTRNSNGTFTKFLRNHPDIFHIDDKRVRLVEQMDIDENEVNQMDYESSQIDKTDINSQENEHWFCFDDSNVTCVTQQHIQRHYGLSDCAYMLFYRLKNNRNKNESTMDCSNTLYSIPQWLIEEISEKNKILEEKREIYEKHQNQLSVIIYPSEWFEVIDNCRLNLNSNSQVLFPDQYGEHKFDKRTKTNEFISNLKDIYGKDSHFYIAKKLRSGQLHIISELKNVSDDNITLDKNDLSNNPNIIVFKYPSILPDTVIQGEEFEPIMLNIVYGFPDAHIHASRLQTIRHVSKNTTLFELKEILFRDFYQYDDPQILRQVRMGKLNLEEKNNRKSRREYKIDEEKQTLAQLYLHDGDTLGIDNKNSFVPSWKDASSNIVNTGKNHLSLTIKNNIDTINTKPMTCSCWNTTLIGEVKLMAIQAFGLSLDPSMCRLYIDDDSDLADIPLYDHQTVDTINFRENNTNLCLKSGQALKENDLMICVQSDREPNLLELIVDYSMTLTDLWNLIKQKLNMDENDNEYHLCEMKSTLINDGSPLNDFDQTLLVNGLTNGAQLTIRSGSIAPRNHIRLKVFKIINQYYKPNEAIHTRPKFEMIELTQRFELPITSSFNALRERIAKLIDFKVPSNYTSDTQPLEFIRLYDIDDNQPTTIVHEPVLTTLKQAKVRDLCSYAFEILSHPEYLSKKDLLLNIVYLKDNTNNYFQHKFELLLPLRDNAIAKYDYLEQHILSHLKSLSNNDIIKITLARYFSDRGQWMIIDPSATTKKTKITNVNLKHEPYKLTDFTVIGVLEGENLTSEDFETEFDQIKRKDIDVEKEQKRMNREKNRTDNDRNQQNGSSGRRKSPQNTMRINVDDFDN